MKISEADDTLLGVVLGRDSGGRDQRREDVGALKERLGVDSELPVP